MEFSTSLRIPPQVRTRDVQQRVYSMQVMPRYLTWCLCLAPLMACGARSGLDVQIVGTSCDSPATSVTDAGALLRSGATDPRGSVPLDSSGRYVMQSTSYQGYCFTFADNFGSTAYPPCGSASPCFSAQSGLCVMAHLAASSGRAWGAGIGCNLNQAQGTDSLALNADIRGKTKITVAVYGCRVPNQLQVQLDVSNPPMDSSGVLGSGYFCNLVTLSAPDASGISTASIPIRDLRQDCWIAGGIPIDPATMLVRTVQLQVNASSEASGLDFCISNLVIT